MLVSNKSVSYCFFFFNSSNSLLIPQRLGGLHAGGLPGIDLAPGDWKVEVVTRYRPNSTTLYKEPRKGSLVFRVV